MKCGHAKPKTSKRQLFHQLVGVSACHYCGYQHTGHTFWLAHSQKRLVFFMMR